MSSTICGPWEDIRTKGEVKTENQDKDYKKPASEEVQQLVMNRYDYFLQINPEKIML